MRRRPPWLLLLVWTVTRAGLFLVATQTIPTGHGDSFSNDVTLYQGWSDVLARGEFPSGDDKWQYPPFAALPMLLPRLLPFEYHVAFYLLSLLCDLAILFLVWRFSRSPRGGGRTGPWAWTIGAALLGPVLLGRYDLMVTLVAVLALTASAHPVVRGALIGVGLIVKVWPVALLTGLRRWRELLTATGSTIVVAVAGCGMAALTLPHALDFLTAQQERGLQIESLAATPFALARAVGWWDGFTTYQHGSMEAVGPGVDTAIWVSLAATPAALVLIGVWWLRAAPSPRSYYDAALTTVLFLVVTSRVLSPQYFVWVIGVAAVLLSVRRTEPGPTQRPAAWLVVVAALLTGIMYPWVEQDYSWEGALPGTVVLTLRNLVFLAAAVTSYVQLWRATRRPKPAKNEQDVPEALPVF
ncbi:glycosyltransferase family 87 protein [Microbispora amethystogenes]|uniref:Membrane protein n=1 Tax=Microbispora amethystogenes TaxID=1427754 RepID=A0ABQ4FF62_9ACTN|nr:glycosyltransferase family 87 protein [Microbispora amethystogenes]GIH33464.1 membrane protein [Microbispora amethystogenes]